MANSPYIPISNYLRPTDVNNDSIPSENRFKFFIDEQNSFFVYKSLACFLSLNARLHLYLKKNELQILIHGIQFDPKLVIRSLVRLLSGSPLLIDKSNFTLFQKVFELLGNKDFQLYFGATPPEYSKQFFLSINSLKGIPVVCIESDLFEPTHLPNFSIPIGLVHLFWEYLIDFQKHIFQRYHRSQVNDFVIVLNQLKDGNYVPINQDQKTFFQSLSIHRVLLNNLSQTNASYYRDNISSPPLPKRQRIPPSHIPKQSIVQKGTNPPHSLESIPDQSAQIDQRNQNIQNLSKMNRESLNKISRLELELKQFKNTQNSSPLNSKDNLLKEELEEIRNQLQEANVKISKKDQENKELISQIQFLNNEQNISNPSQKKEIEQSKSNFNNQFSNQKQNYGGQLKTLQNENISLKEENSILKNQTHELSQQNDGLNGKVTNLLKINQHILGENEKLKQRIQYSDLLSQQNNTLSNENEELKDQIKYLSAQIQNSKIQDNLVPKEVSQLKKEKESLLHENDELKNQIDYLSFQNQNSTKKDGFNIQIQNELHNLKIQNESLLREKEELCKQIKGHSSQIQNSNDSIENQVNNLQKQNKFLLTEKDELNKQIKDLSSQIQISNEAQNLFQKQVKNLQNQNQSLLKGNEGLNKQIKDLSSQNHNSREINDLIQKQVKNLQKQNQSLLREKEELCKQIKDHSSQIQNSND
jgi:chromosome segregation ATPase